MSNGRAGEGEVQDQARRDRNEQVKQALKTLTTEPAYCNIDLSGLQKLTQIVAPNHQVTCGLIQHISSQIQACWLCLPLAHKAYIGTPVPSYRSSTQVAENNIAQNYCTN